MNWQESQDSREFYSSYREPSRADLALGGLVLAFFAALLATNLNTTPDMGSMIIRAVVGLSLAVGAAICLTCAVRGESHNRHLTVQPMKIETQQQRRLAERVRRSA